MVLTIDLSAETFILEMNNLKTNGNGKILSDTLDGSLLYFHMNV